MDGMDGWDGRLSSSASLLRAPYGANKFDLNLNLGTETERGRNVGIKYLGKESARA